MLFYGEMLGILILQLNIQKELKKLTNKLLNNLIMIELSFQCKKKILIRLKWWIMFALMCLLMKISWFFQCMFQIKTLKTQWIYCCLKMIIILIVCTSNILIDLCFTKQKIKIKSTFVEAVYSVLLVKIFWQNIEKIA